MASDTSRKEEIARLIRLGAQSRAQIGGNVRHLRRQLDVPHRLRSSLDHHPSLWMAGSLVSGLAASTLFRRRPPKPKKKAGVAALLLGLTLTAVKPAAKIWLTNRATDWITARSAQRRTTRIHP